MNIKKSLMNRVGFALGFLIVGAICVWTMYPLTLDVRPSNDQIEPPTYTEQLIEKHDCWSGNAPSDMEGMFPKHVVLNRGGVVAEYLGPKWSQKALDQIFAGKDYNLTVYAFCR